VACPPEVDAVLLPLPPPPQAAKVSATAAASALRAARPRRFDKTFRDVFACMVSSTSRGGYSGNPVVCTHNL